MSVDRLLLIYNADHGIGGDLVYGLRKLMRRGGCALCDITHGIREKAEWRETRDQLGVPVQTLYRDQVTVAQRNAANNTYPCVLGQTAMDLKIVLGPDEIASCGGSPERLECLLREAAAID